MARILVVDDDADARAAIGAWLEGAGHEVVYAPNGEVGLEAYKRQPSDLVLVDLVMPVKNGLVTIRELCELDRMVRIIAITDQDPGDLDRALEYGAKGSLLKPIDADGLFEAVASVMRRSTGWDDAGVTI